MRVLKFMFVGLFVVATSNVACAGYLDGLSLGGGASAASGLNGLIGFRDTDSRHWFVQRTRFRLDFASTEFVHSMYDSIVDSFIGDDGYKIDDITIRDVDIDAKHMSILVDFYPLANSRYWCGWRMTAGYAKGAINVDAELTGAVSGAPSGSFGFKLGNTYYYYTGNTVHGSSEIDWKYHGPYIGTGFDWRLFAGFGIYMDLGVVWTTKKPVADLYVPFKNLYQSTDGGQTWQNVEDDNLEAIVEAERQKSLTDVQRDLDKLHFVPMVKVGFMYQF